MAKVSIRARELIDQYGLDPDKIEGTGKGGLITLEDVKRVIESGEIEQVKMSAFEQACKELKLDPEVDVAAWREYPDRVVIIQRPTGNKLVWVKNRGIE